MATIYHQVWTSAPAATIYAAIARAETIGTWWAPQTAVETADGVVLEPPRPSARRRASEGAPAGP
jgi:hypothetical protein